MLRLPFFDWGAKPEEYDDVLTFMIEKPDVEVTADATSTSLSLTIGTLQHF